MHTIRKRIVWLCRALPSYRVWLCRAWSVIVPLFIVAIYLFVKVLFPSHIETISNILSKFCQLFGGIIVLYIINCKLKLLRRCDLLDVVCNWYKERPRYGDITLSLNGISINVEQGNISVEQGNVASDINNRDGEMDSMRDEVDSVRDKIDLVLSLFEKTLLSFGDSELQVFGALLIIFGVIID